MHLLEPTQGLYLNCYLQNPIFVSAVLEPTQGLYLNEKEEATKPKFLYLEPTQGLYLNIGIRLIVLQLQILEPTQGLYLNGEETRTVIASLEARTDTRVVFKCKCVNI